MCVTAQKMRGGPSEPVCRSRLQTTLSCCGKESWWLVSVKEKVLLDGIRYDSMETNESEPPMKCRKRREVIKTGG
jgi:hypothetical protein